MPFTKTYDASGTLIAVNEHHLDDPQVIEDLVDAASAGGGVGLVDDSDDTNVYIWTGPITQNPIPGTISGSATGNVTLTSLADATLGSFGTTTVSGVGGVMVSSSGDDITIVSTTGDVLVQAPASVISLTAGQALVSCDATTGNANLTGTTATLVSFGDMTITVGDELYVPVTGTATIEGATTVNVVSTAGQVQVQGNTGASLTATTGNAIVNAVDIAGGGFVYLLGAIRAGGGTDKIGFFGTAPIVKPTGVAVDAAGIHAALVALGLIAA